MCCVSGARPGPGRKTRHTQSLLSGGEVSIRQTHTAGAAEAVVSMGGGLGGLPRRVTAVFSVRETELGSGHGEAGASQDAGATVQTAQRARGRQHESW